MQEKRWTFWALAVYFVIFTIFLFAPMIVMAVLSFQGPEGQLQFPMRGASFHWWQALFQESVGGSQATAIKDAGLTSLYLGLVVGGVVTALALTLSMAFRRRFRGDGVLFYLVLLALMTPGFLLSLGSSLWYQTLGISTTTLPPDVFPLAAVGTNVVWGLPFGFLIMVAVWNRYDKHVEEASRDLGASSGRTFREVTLPLIWTGLFGAFLFGFLLSWNEYDRTALLLTSGQLTLPVQIFALTTGSVIQPNLYALGAASTALVFLLVGLILVFAWFRGRGGSGRPTLEQQVAEELGEVEAIDAEALESAVDDGPAGAGGRAG